MIWNTSRRDPGYWERAEAGRLTRQIRIVLSWGRKARKDENQKTGESDAKAVYHVSDNSDGWHTGVEG